MGSPKKTLAKAPSPLKTDSQKQSGSAAKEAPSKTPPSKSHPRKHRSSKAPSPRTQDGQASAKQTKGPIPKTPSPKEQSNQANVNRTKTPLSKAPLFKDISDKEVRGMLPCLGHITKHYLKGERILRAGERPSHIGILSEGRLHIETSDVWGRTTILESLKPGAPFAVAYACANQGATDVDVVADEDCVVEHLEVSRALSVCPKRCACHATLVRNMLVSMANKNIALNRRAIALAPKSVRGKLMAYLSLQQKLNVSSEFEIPFTHEELASYLGVDRSTLSSELAALRREGVIDYKGKKYRLLEG